MSIVTQDEETPFDFRRQQLVERNCKTFVNTLQGAAFEFSNSEVKTCKTGHFLICIRVMNITA